MNANRRMRLAVVPAALAALTLAGCQDEAPEAAPPQAPSQTQPSDQPSQAPTQAPSQAPSQAPTQAPTSEAPSSAAPGGGGDTGQSSGKTCEDDGSSFQKVKGSAQAKPNGSMQTFQESSGTVDITVGAPTIDSSGGDSYFPGDGMVAATYPITIKMTSGSYFITSRLDFGMVDDQDNSCKDDGLGTVLPRGQQIEVKSLKQGDTYSGKIAFAVPAGADLSKYSLLYAENSSGKADLAWTGK